MALLRYVFELYLGGSWVDVTSFVRHQKVTVKRGTTDESPKLTPASAALTLENGDDRFNPRNPTGPYYGQLVRNTPIRISCAGGVSDAFRFHGEVYSFAPRWNEDRSNCTVPIEANGALRRLIGGDVQPRSYYRSWWNNQGPLDPWPTPRFFWPLEEGSDASGAQPEIGKVGAATLTNAPAKAVWGAAKMNDWLPNGIALDNLNTLTFPCNPGGWSTAAWEMACLLTFPTNETVALFEIDCVTQTWYVYMYNNYPDWDDCSWTIVRPDGGVSVIPIFSDPANLKDLGPVWMNFRLYFTGSAVSAALAAGAVGTQSNSVNVVGGGGSISTLSGKYPRQIKLSVSSNTSAPTTATSNYLGVSAFSVSECTIGTVNMNLSYAATKGAPSETTYDRFTRMCDEQGINNATDTAGAVPMGRQYVQGLEKHFLEILSSSRHSGIVEARDANQLKLLGTGTYRGDIAYTDIRPDLEPVEDDKNTANILRVNNSHGESVTLTKATGDMSVAQIGPFEGKIDTNNRRISAAASVAGARLALGTWPGPRFTEITVSARARPALYNLLRSIDVGDFFGVTGLASAGYYDTLIMKVLHIREDISQPDHVFTFTVRPGELDYRLWTIGTNRLDIADSTVAVGGSGSTIDVNVPTAKWSLTAAPFDVMVSGERMTVTAVTTLTSTTQRLTVTRAVNGVVKSTPVGAEVHLFPGFYIKAV